MKRTLALAIAVGVSASVAISQGRPEVPVSIGGEESTEGCHGSGAVILRDPESYVNLRSGPNIDYAVLDRLRQNQSLSICEQTNDGWIGVVIHPTDASIRDCNLSDAGPKPKPYNGPCKSGWVAQEYIRLVAG